MTIKKTPIQLATRTDRDDLIRLIHGYLDFYQVPHPDEHRLHDLLDTLEAQPERGVQLIAKIDGKAVAFATLYATFSTLRAQKAMVMNDLFVEPEYRQAGVGQELFAACKRYVEENGYAFMEWVTADDNEVAQRFYERQGASRSSWVVYSI